MRTDVFLLDNLFDKDSVNIYIYKFVIFNKSICIKEFPLFIYILLSDIYASYTSI